MSRKNELISVLLETAACEIELLSSSDDEIDEILDNLQEDIQLVSVFRYTHRSFVPKKYEWFENVLPNLDDGRFKQIVRVDRVLFNVILDLIKDNPVFNGVNSKLQFSTFFQLALVMFRLGSSGENASLAKIAAHFGVGDGGTIDKVTNRVFKSILCLEKDFLTWPSQEERENIILETNDELPFCIGYIDGLEIPLNETPSLDPISYFSKSKQYAIKLQAVCDYKYRIRHIHVGYPGSVHDSSIFNNSSIGKDIQRFLSPGQWIAGDSAYRLTEHLITPFRKNSSVSTAEKRKRFNRYFSSFRVRIENCFGILKEKFVSLKDLKISIADRKSHQFACTWVRICCILHNIILPHLNIEDFLFPTTNENEDNENVEGNGIDTENAMENYIENSVEQLGENKRLAICELVMPPDFDFLNIVSNCY